ncbi:S8 family serine peptidase [Dokdonella fugitiva]|nr:S8 family serine peptidase [Dokdonella fugitiva]
MSSLLSFDAVKNSTLRLVKFGAPITAQQRAAVEAAGAQIISYAPHYAYLVRMPADLDAAMRAIDGVVWSGPFLPALKVDANIYAQLQGNDIATAAGIDALEISIDASADRYAVQDAIASTPGLAFANAVVAGGETRLLARFERSQLRTAVERLATDPGVLAIGFHKPMRLYNSQADWLHQSNINTPSPFMPVFDRGIYGCGQIIGELDTGLWQDNVAFKDASQATPINICDTGSSCPGIPVPNLAARKVISYYKWSGDAGGSWADEHGHGTHVAGSLIGNDNVANPGTDCTGFTTPGGNTNLDGTAPGAKLVMQESGSDLRYLNTQGGTPYHAAQIAYDNGARLHSDSWGGGCTDQFGLCISGCTVTYDETARDADRVMKDHPDLLMVFAAGNDATTCSNGNNVGSPGNAKNVLTIGANNRGTAGNAMASFSSRGPTLDSRTKPDLTAQGASIVSAARNASGTTTMSGTSMATPTAAGLAALVRDYLARGFYPTGQKVAGNAIPNPSGALVKAIMLAGASTLTGSGAGTNPGQSQGWGRIHLDNSLYFNGDQSHLYIHDAPAGLATGGVDNHSLTVAAGQPLVIALTWTDVAAAVGASPATVNSLRLEVQAPNGDVWTQKLPAGYNVNNATPTQSTATSNYDDLNTVQRISFTAPAAGTYQIRVRGINVPSGPQKYALAAIGSFTVSSNPDYALLTNPASIAVCAGTPGGIDVGVQSLSGFSDPVALSVTGLPGATTGVFSVTPVTPADPPATSHLTIGNTAGVASGNYNLSINGLSNGTTPIAHTAAATMSVTAAAPVAGTLTSPANGASGVGTTPTFTWSAIADAAQYRFQLSTDAAFGTFVENQVLSSTSFTPATALNPNTTYYWRIYGVNGCGEGAASAVSSFTTANMICRAPHAAIPDNNATGLTDTLNVTDASTLTGLKLSIKATHTWVGDLKFTLKKVESNTSSIVIDRPGVPASTNGCSSDNVDVVIDDAATTVVENQCNAAPPALSGNVKPNNPLATPFNGQTLGGTWTLNVSDAAGQDTGTLDEWCLLPATSTGPTTFTVGGNVGGLTGSGLELSLNAGAQTVPVATNGAFTFPTGLANGAAYAVTVGTQPSGQTCSVANGSGTISGANVTNVTVTCAATPTYTIGGNVGGLTGSGLVLSLNAGAQTLPVAANGAFTFPTGLADGAAYAVTVGTQPAGQTCSVANGSGTVAAANVTDVDVACVDDVDDLIFADGFDEL